RMRHRPAVLVQHAAVHHDALADRLALVLAREVAVGRFDIVGAEDRARDLGEGLRRQHQRLRRAALLRRAVRRKVVVGLGARLITAVTGEPRGARLTRRLAAWTVAHGRRPPAACTFRTRAWCWDTVPGRSGSAWR